MTATPRVSVVMSVYNGDPFVASAIEGILNQTLTDLEFIVVDDGSKDRTCETIARYAARDPRIIRLHNQSNVGVVKALNRGLALARGEYIARQDADDISLPQRLEKQVAYLDRHPDTGLVAMVPRLVGSDGEPLQMDAYTATENSEIQHRLLDQMCLCGPTIVVRRTAFEAGGYYFSEGLDASEDYDLCLRIAEVTRMASLSDRLYIYRQHADSASRKRYQQQMLNKAIALERAVYRRFGPNPGAEQSALVARDYLHAAIIYFTGDDVETAREGLASAMAYWPGVLAQDEPCETMLRSYTPAELQAALEFTGAIFRHLLPATRRMLILKSRLLSDLHMKEVFASADSRQPRRVLRHAWHGIRYRPKWLLNRGVVMILLRSMVKGSMGCLSI